MVLRERDCTTWMTSAQAKQITCTIKPVATNEKFGYGIGAWGTHHLVRHLLPSLFSSLQNVDFKCDTCIKAKSQRVSYPVSLTKTNTPCALIHSDVWGPSPITTSSSYHWFVIFVDDCTQMTWLYRLKTKNEVFTIFKHFMHGSNSILFKDKNSSFQ